MPDRVSAMSCPAFEKNGRYLIFSLTILTMVFITLSGRDIWSHSGHDEAAQLEVTGRSGDPRQTKRGGGPPRYSGSTDG